MSTVTSLNVSSRLGLLLHKLLPKVLGLPCSDNRMFVITSFYNVFHFMSVGYVVHIGFLYNFHELYLYLSVVFYIAFYNVYHCN